MEQGNFTYILECSDGSFYTGWTNNLERRVKAHNAGKGAKYTKSRKPVKLVYFETFLTKQEAMRREWEIKQLSRVEKWKLIQAKKQIKIQNRTATNRHNGMRKRAVCFFVSKQVKHFSKENRYFDLKNNFILL